MSQHTLKTLELNNDVQFNYRYLQFQCSAIFSPYRVGTRCGLLLCPDSRKCSTSGKQPQLAVS